MQTCFIVDVILEHYLLSTRTNKEQGIFSGHICLECARKPVCTSVYTYERLSFSYVHSVLPLWLFLRCDVPHMSHTRNELFIETPIFDSITTIYMIYLVQMTAAALAFMETPVYTEVLE